MLKQAYDFKDESNNLHKILENLSEDELDEKTLFKNWSFNRIIRHLHVWNYGAKISLVDKNKWTKFYNKLRYSLSKGKNLNDFENDFTNNLKGKSLLDSWKKLYEETAEIFKFEDPKNRVKWVGPDMSVISSISARHMETWAHGQAIFDSLGVHRVNQDRIINIVIMGKNTFNWSFRVNNLNIPKAIPFLQFTSPSGKLWTFNEVNKSNYINGLAEDFCQVVTQVRNIKDVNLKVHGAISKKWMQIAQCFAGKAQKPPKPGYRKIQK